MIHSGNFWLYSLLSLLTLRGLCSLGIFVAKQRSMSITALDTLKEREKTLNRLTKVAVFGLTCVMGGYLLRSYELASNTDTLANVLILKQHSPAEFTMMTDKGQAFEATFCDDSLPKIDLQRGHKLQVINYEQRPDCKSLMGKNLGFIAYTDKEGNRIIFPTGDTGHGQ